MDSNPASFEKNESWMEGLILAQGERWRRA